MTGYNLGLKKTFDSENSTLTPKDLVMVVWHPLSVYFGNDTHRK